MKCINHDTTDAVATCTECGKAFCRSCIDSTKPRIVCENCIIGEVRTCSKIGLFFCSPIFIGLSLYLFFNGASVWAYLAGGFSLVWVALCIFRLMQSTNSRWRP